MFCFGDGKVRGYEGLAWEVRSEKFVKGMEGGL